MQYANMMVGRVGHNLKLRQTSGDHSVLTVSVAESRLKKGESGWDTNTVWHELTAWNNVAQRMVKIMKKGSLAVFHFRIDYKKMPVQGKEGVVNVSVPNLVVVAFSCLANYGNSESKPP